MSRYEVCNEHLPVRILESCKYSISQSQILPITTEMGKARGLHKEKIQPKELEMELCKCDY